MTTRDLAAYLGQPYATEVVPEATTTGGMTYRASHPELPGCEAHGETPEEAMQNLVEARELYIGTLLHRGLEVPRPGRSGFTAVWRTYGIVMPRALTTAPAIRTIPQLELTGLTARQ